MKITYTIKENTLCIMLLGEIDHHIAKNIRNYIDTLIDDMLPHTLIMDFSGVNFMDSSGIGLLLGRYQKMKINKGNLKIINASKTILKILEMSGIKMLISINQTEGIIK